MLPLSIIVSFLNLRREVCRHTRSVNLTSAPLVRCTRSSLFLFVCFCVVDDCLQPLGYWRERWPTPDGDFVDIDWLPAEEHEDVADQVGARRETTRF